MQAHKLLELWGYKDMCHDIVRDVDVHVERLSFKEATKYCEIQGEFEGSCSLFVNAKGIDDISRIKISQLSPATKKNINICILKSSERMHINIGGSNNNIFISRFGYSFNSVINIWNDSNLIISDEATCNGARMLLNNSSIFIGYDCMLSDEILIQSADQHGIVDLESMNIINNMHKSIIVGCHVWIGRRATVMSGSKIGDGSIIGAGATVTSEIEKCTIAVGSPAKVIRRNTSWSRNPGMINEKENLIFESFSRNK